ncbi:DNA-binding transcriptional regulator, GntR family [Pseudobutyrivibrio sp. 49]|uniref:GntR family transcriptional regulator n=1 Tax=Pseudobutyrivibrio sp. 49 TaxID=1855344 RepID=UPI00087F213C|nr:GntR family transcriptional regulator [Pseudobutyrivibrio sp. 49]SDI18719.1 DNA-binding transcriptional regulator, GntR family [Pseudobutyrivibrio sp. 49]
MKKIERINSETAREYALRAITENIKSADLEPGQAISENEISAFLGVSRTPVRESIQELHKAALIEIYPQKGSYVSLINSQYVEEAVFLRKVLDIAVIEEACDMATEEDIKLLEENVALQEFYLEKDNTEKIFELDNEFHRMIYVAAKKETIHHMSQMIMIHFDRVRTLSMLTVKDKKIVGDHRLMLDAIKEKDKEKAKAIVEKHLDRYRLDQEELIKAFPQYFETTQQ